MGHLDRDKAFSVVDSIGLANQLLRIILQGGRSLYLIGDNFYWSTSLPTNKGVELLCMIFLKVQIHISKGGFQNILVGTDHFTNTALPKQLLPPQPRSCMKSFFFLQLWISSQIAFLTRKEHLRHLLSRLSSLVGIMNDTKLRCYEYKLK